MVGYPKIIKDVYGEVFIVTQMSEWVFMCINCHPAVVPPFWISSATSVCRHSRVQLLPSCW